MRTWAIFASLVLFFVVAQSQSNSDLDLAIMAIQAHFNQSHIVPDFLANFQPKALLDVSFGQRSIEPGQLFTKEQVGSAPTLAVQSTSPLSGNYLLAMLDTDVPNSKPPQGTNRHWLVRGVTIDQNSMINNATATVTTRYWGPWPPAGSGPHRYVVMLYSQPDNFAPPSEFAGNDMPVEPMDWNAYVTDSHLGDLFAANYFQVEEGTANTSIFSTAPVITSTLQVASSSASASTPPSSSSRSSNTSGNSGVSALSLSMPVILSLASLTTFVIV
ncbi:hypothetical protein Ac2012v2_001552 [Leucoagaricus gongylophorus]